MAPTAATRENQKLAVLRRGRLKSFISAWSFLTSHSRLSASVGLTSSVMECTSHEKSPNLIRSLPRRYHLKTLLRRAYFFRGPPTTRYSPVALLSSRGRES